MNPNKLEKKMMEEAFFFFKITKHDGNVYYFTLGEDKDEYPIYTGKFIKK